MDWVTPERAEELTGVAVTDAQLQLAADEVYRVLRWTPVFGDDLTGEGMLPRMQRSDLAAAIAWQAAFNHEHPGFYEETPALRSERILNWSGTYDAPSITGAGGLGKRAWTILSSSGLIRMAGRSYFRPERRSAIIEVEPD